MHVQSWLQVSNNTGILNTCTQLWLTKSEQAGPVDSIKDIVWSSVKVPDFDKHLKKAGEHISWNIVEIIMKMKTIVQKPLMIYTLVSLFNDISTFVDYLIPNPSLQKYYLIHNWGDKGVHAFPRGISPKVNAIVQLEITTMSQSSTLTTTPWGPPPEFYGFKHFYIILLIYTLIFKQIYLIHRRDPNRYIQSGPESNGNLRTTSHPLELQNWSLTTICRLVSYPHHPF